MTFYHIRDLCTINPQVVRMFIIIVTIFAICWLPYHLFFVYAYHNNQVTSTSYVQQMYLAFYWLAMSNAMVNPLIYYWMNGRFRVYFQEIICYCCLRVWKAHNKGAGDKVPGILSRRNSQSDFARTKSCEKIPLNCQVTQSRLILLSSYFHCLQVDQNLCLCSGIKQCQEIFG